MEVDELLKLIEDTDMKDVHQVALLRALLVSKTVQPFDMNNFDVELEALIIQVRERSQQTLDANLTAIKNATKTMMEGKPSQALVGGTYELVNNWMGLIGGLIAPWKSFTKDITMAGER